MTEEEESQVQKGYLSDSKSHSSFQAYSTLEAHEKQHRGLQRLQYKVVCNPSGNGIEKTSVCSYGFQVQAKHNYNNTSKGQKFDQKQEDKRSSAVSQLCPSQGSGDVPCPSGFFHQPGSWNSSGFGSLSPRPDLGFPAPFHCPWLSQGGAGDEEEHNCRMGVFTMEICDGSERVLCFQDQRDSYFPQRDKLNAKSSDSAESLRFKQLVREMGEKRLAW